MSPDVKNSIHVGDRILEINGTPIRNVPLDEVGLQGSKAGAGWSDGSRAFTPALHCHLRTLTWMLPCPQIDLLIQETSRLLQLTLEHDPHDTLGHGPGSEPSPLGSPVQAPSGQAGSSARQKPVL